MSSELKLNKLKVYQTLLNLYIENEQAPNIKLLGEKTFEDEKYRRKTSIAIKSLEKKQLVKKEVSKINKKCRIIILLEIIAENQAAFLGLANDRISRENLIILAKNAKIYSIKCESIVPTIFSFNSLDRLAFFQPEEDNQKDKILPENIITEFSDWANIFRAESKFSDKYQQTYKNFKNVINGTDVELLKHYQKAKKILETPDEQLPEQYKYDKKGVLSFKQDVEMLMAIEKQISNLPIINFNSI